MHLSQKLGLIFTLQSISLLQFKNYNKATFRFTERIVGICGPNGIGKTNLLDAIYNLCFTKSYFNRSDLQSVEHNQAGFRLEGEFEKNGQKIKVVSVLRENARKEFSAGGQVYERLAGHIGLFPAVIIVPDDIILITGGSEERRRFLDTLFSQIDQDYLQHLILYNRVLQQRNAYLKSVDASRRVNSELIEVLDQQLILHGNLLYQKRKSFLELLMPLVTNYYSGIAGQDETIVMRYESQLQDADFSALLKDNRDKDLILQRTTQGIHKDDVSFTFKDRIFKTEASQGQRKSLLFALKLAEFQMLKDNKGFAPLLLLDDVFEKLDEHRISNLLSWVCLKNNGQIFITDTHAARFTENINRLGINYQLADI